MKNDMPLFQTGDLVLRLNLSNGMPAVPEIALVVDTDELHFAIYNGRHMLWASHPIRYEYRLLQKSLRGGGDE